MDKAKFIYSVNGLRTHEAAGKIVYPGGIDLGQKRMRPEIRGFCTSAPVDMQAFFHSRVGL